MRELTGCDIWQLLKIRTKEVLYERYRTEKLLARRATRNISEDETRRLLEGASLLSVVWIAGICLMDHFYRSWTVIVFGYLSVSVCFPCACSIFLYLLTSTCALCCSCLPSDGWLGLRS